MNASLSVQLNCPKIMLLWKLLNVNCFNFKVNSDVASNRDLITIKRYVVLVSFDRIFRFKAIYQGVACTTIAELFQIYEIG